MKLRPALPNDVCDILDAAALLDTSEFNIFSIAYRKWFGKNAPEKIIENYYTAYMFNAVVPYWSRHFARTIIRLSSTGSLNPNDFVENTDHVSTRTIFIARAFIISGAVVMLILLLGAIYAAHDSPITYSCFFPPCY